MRTKGERKLECEKGEKPKRLRRDTRGAVLAEFVVAVVPLLTTFFCFVQLMKMQQAKLVIRNSAISAARAAIVIHENGNNPGKHGQESDIEWAAALAVGPYADSFGSLEVTTNDNSSVNNTYGPVTVTVKGTYKCQVPLGKLICVGGGGFSKTLEASATMPHQGARYKE